MLVGAKRSLIRRPAIVASSSFTPADLFTGSEDGCWLDFSDLSSMFQNIDGTTAVASASDPIGYATDLSGNTNHAVGDANDTTRPTYVSGGGGQFGATDSKRLTVSLTSNITTTAVYAMVVMNPASSEGSNGRYLSYCTSGQEDFNSFERAATLYVSGGSVLSYRGSAAKSSGSYTASQNQAVETVYDGTDHTMYVDGSAGTSVGSTGSFNFSLIGIGGRANGASGTDYINGQVMEIIIRDSVPTSEEITSLRSYVNTKWSIS